MESLRAIEEDLKILLILLFARCVYLLLDPVRRNWVVFAVLSALLRQFHWKDYQSDVFCVNFGPLALSLVAWWKRTMWLATKVLSRTCEIMPDQA